MGALFIHPSSIFLWQPKAIAKELVLAHCCWELPGQVHQAQCLLLALPLKMAEVYPCFFPAMNSQMRLPFAPQKWESQHQQNHQQNVTKTKKSPDPFISRDLWIPPLLDPGRPLKRLFWGLKNMGILKGWQSQLCRRKIPSQVIQSDHFIPNVKGHQQPLSSGHVFTIPKRSRSQNCQVYIFLLIYIFMFSYVQIYTNIIKNHLVQGFWNKKFSSKAAFRLRKQRPVWLIAKWFTWHWCCWWVFLHTKKSHQKKTGEQTEPKKCLPQKIAQKKKLCEIMFLVNMTGKFSEPA